MVELLAAALLSTLLFVTAVYVIRSFSQARGLVAQSHFAWELAACQQIRWDFTNAVVLIQNDHGLILGGYGSLDRDTGESSHLPVLINYSIRTINSRQWLVREQSSLDPLVPSLNSSELLCGDVKAFSMTGSYSSRTLETEAATLPEGDPTPVVFQRVDGAQRMPNRVRLRIEMSDDPTPFIDTVLYLK